MKKPDLIAFWMVVSCFVVLLVVTISAGVSARDKLLKIERSCQISKVDGSAICPTGTFQWKITVNGK